MLTSEEARTNPSQVVCENKLAVAGYGCARSGGGAGGGQEQARARERLRGIARSRDFFFTRTRGLQCVAPVRVPGQLFTFPAAFEFLMPRSTEGSVDGLASGQSDPALVPEAPIGLIKKGQHQCRTLHTRSQQGRRASGLAVPIIELLNLFLQC